MTRGRQRKDRDGPERRCIVSGDSGPVGPLIRFVLGPDGSAVPDLAAKLPGRGAWLTADRDMVAHALKKRAFARAFRQTVDVPEDLADRLEAMLAQRVIDLVSLARKAGQAVMGHEKSRSRIREGTTGVLLQASDGAADGKSKLSALARAVGGGEIAEIEVLDASELGLAFGREFAIHAALDAGGFAVRVRTEAERLAGFRRSAPDGAKAGDTTLQGVSGLAHPRASKTTNEGPMCGTLEQDDK